jgi:hypothetical protein
VDVVSWAIRPWLSQGAVGVVYQCKVKCRGRMFGCWLGAVDVVCGCKADAKAGCLGVGRVPWMWCMGLRLMQRQDVWVLVGCRGCGVRV